MVNCLYQRMRENFQTLVDHSASIPEMNMYYITCINTFLKMQNAGLLSRNEIITLRKYAFNLRNESVEENEND